MSFGSESGCNLRLERDSTVRVNNFTGQVDGGELFVVVEEKNLMAVAKTSKIEIFNYGTLVFYSM